MLVHDNTLDFGLCERKSATLFCLAIFASTASGYYAIHPQPISNKELFCVPVDYY